MISMFIILEKSICQKEKPVCDVAQLKNVESILFIFFFVASTRDSSVESVCFRSVL